MAWKEKSGKPPMRALFQKARVERAGRQKNVAIRRSAEAEPLLGEIVIAIGSE
jgi:hypothetical protein